MFRVASQTFRTRSAGNLFQQTSSLWRSRHPLYSTTSASSGVARLTTQDIIGIDLGTTNSCVAVVRSGGDVVVLENSEGRRTTPSVVAWDRDGRMLVGDAARRQAVTNPKGTIFAAKRLIGRRFDDPAIVKTQKHVPYKVTNEKGDAWVEVGGKKYSPAQIGAFVLQKMKETADNYLGAECTRAIITVPAYFNDSQRQATKDAGTISGLLVERIINEPTAAAMAYGLNKTADGTIAVFDLGGGTFDISVLEIKGGVFEVKSTNGDTFLGGEDFDTAIMQHLLEQCKAKYNLDLSKDLVALGRFREAAEKAKKDLDHQAEVEVEIPFLTLDASGNPVNYSYTFTQEGFNALVKSLVQRAEIPCQNAMKDAGVTPKDLSQVILVGGMTRTPCVVSHVKKIFRREPYKGVNPDEVVAMGAALQGGVMRGHTTGMLLVDVTPLSLGTETVGGVFTRIINRNTKIPVTQAKEFTTASDNQTEIHVKVLQGEREVAAKNHLLGDFVLNGLPPLPHGVPKISIQFEIDSNGIVKVTASDKGTGKETSIKVEAKSGLSEEDVKRMLEEAEQAKEEDMKKTKVIELRINFDEAINKTRSFAETLDDARRDALEDAIAEAEKAKDDENATIESLQEAMATLSAANAAAYNKA
eukprot:TRINITY_DN391_c0_g1_i1.p1 TRINITY_DN391_c0_g1~~TRINITY_DN391_c0_g1_i1.p1  ORF type:complete len:642 (-),score=185.56 TRINITY_DN391_c0_g1_i1:105-2030(-)